MEPFDLTGALPTPGTTTVLEASAGTGKTFALAGLVTRYVAEGVATLDQMLLITFSRAASRELRERVRGQIVDAVAALEGRDVTRSDLIDHLLTGPPDAIDARRARLRDALAGFDAATIATTHEFCGLVLKSLGVAGDTDSGVRLVEGLDDLVTEIVNDLYLADYGQQTDDPPLGYQEALAMVRTVVGDPCAQLRPEHPDEGSEAAARLEFATKVLAELERRKRRLGILHFDDLLSRLAKALEPEDSPARQRMHQRWPIVMVDEFQDTDPVQWQVIDRAFGGRSTVILIGDPKQAIYAFRGGDIFTYLAARRTARAQQTLGVNWRSDAVLVDRLRTVLRGAELGHQDIVVRDIEAHHHGHRLTDAPHNAPFRLRLVSREGFGVDQDKVIPIAKLRPYIAKDLAADVAELLDSGATFDGESLDAGDIAVIVERTEDARRCRDALANVGIAAIYTGDSDVFERESEAADAWLRLLEAFDQPHRSGLVRSAAATVFFGMTADDLAAGGDELTEWITETIRQWSDQARERGVAAVFEAAQVAGMSERVLSRRGGERLMTDLAHVAHLLHEVAHRERFSLPALRDWLRRQRDERSGPTERNRRLDSDAKAVQIMTVWGSKGLQFPIVYLPFAFNRHVFVDDIPLYHDDADVRCLHIGGKDSPDRDAIEEFSRIEAARNDIRLTYVALTRAESQVVAWWAPASDERNGGLSRLMRGRQADQAEVPDRCDPRTVSDDEALECFREWERAGGPVIEEATIADAVAPPRPAPSTDLGARHFHRAIDTTWRRTSYSALIRGAETVGVASEPEITELDDEVGDVPVAAAPAGAGVPSPMADLPTGAKFGTLVHAVLETADPLAEDLVAELSARVDEHSMWWPVDVSASELAAAMVPMHDTPLGPLADGLTLRQIGLADRLQELDFEFPLAGGDLREAAPDIRLADVGALLRSHLPADDPLAVYADRLTGDALGGQSLRGYLSGSVDAVLRIPDGDGHRYLVVDFKTNWLGESDRPLTAADYDRPRLVDAMLHSDYPLQALLYCVVLHRFLRWRQPGYDPQRHLGGVLYLFLRGMCGPETPVVDGNPAGVFSWQPPASLVVALSDLLDAGRAAA